MPAKKPETSAADYLPERLSLKTLREAVQLCRGCDLYKDATQAVFGEGRRRSQVMFVGEKPGAREDEQGQPFVGPAGRLLDRAMVDAGIDRTEAYVTNAVKHFKYVRRGKRRIHQKPNSREVAACRPWLEAEIQVVEPALIVALGATAAKSLYGNDFRVTRQRGEVFESQWAPLCSATVHPSSILRMNRPEREQGYAGLVADLESAAAALRGSA